MNPFSYSNFPMPKVLVIDDDPTIQLLLKKALHKQGYEVFLAHDGDEGILKAQQIQPALIICDWVMPKIDGLEVCRRIKSDPKLTTTFFILVTAKGTVEDRVEGLDTGADDFLTKPIELDELQARVRAGLRLHQLSQDLQTQKKILELELTEAAEYVRSLLPSPLQGKVTLNSRFIPSRLLGGDCFDYYWLDPDFLVIYLLDVSGHGLGAALPSISVLNMLRSQSLPDVNFYRPHDVLRALNETFQMNRQNEKYFTIWYGVYNHSKRQLAYASAGHPPAILISPSTNGYPQVKRLKTPGLPIGVLADTTFISDRQEIPKGSQLYIFSDGTFDFREAREHAWGLDAFAHQLASYPTADLDQILEAIKQRTYTELFNDDLSLLQVKFD
jgi:sigma-B regulation protein RsbU (phosphoserine phosphatase)